MGWPEVIMFKILGQTYSDNCNCYTKAYHESTGGCPEHGIYISDKQIKTAGILWQAKEG